MAKPAGSRMVVCKGGHTNYLLPGTERQCTGEKCKRVVKRDKISLAEALKAATKAKYLPKALKAKSKPAKPAKAKPAKSSSTKSSPKKNVAKKQPPKGKAKKKAE